VLIDFSRSVFAEMELLSRGAESIIPRRRGAVFTAAKRLLSPRNRVAERSVEHVQDLLAGRPQAPAILVVGGGAIGNGMDSLYRDRDVRIIGFDIYASPLVQFVADGHMIPLADATVDAVVVQAVLQHVLDPARVVSEIHRVLKIDGIVYAETAFMQQVCEGPYDFVRFTESGHRYLFQRFDEIESGAVAGSGTQLMWSIDYFVRGLFRSRTAGRLARAACCWLPLLDGTAPRPYSIDDASCVYFLGRRRATGMSPQEIIARYKGAQIPRPRRGRKD
jgi:SAM-dependent methyltransferase